MKLIKFILFLISVIIYSFAIMVSTILVIMLCINPNYYLVIFMTFLPVIIIMKTYKNKFNDRTTFFLKALLIFIVMFILPFIMYDSNYNKNISFINCLNYISEWYQPWNRQLGKCWGLRLQPHIAAKEFFINT